MITRHARLRFLQVALGLLALTLLGGTALAATTWTVDDDMPADFATIQAAINAAAPGDTILVAPGAYNENLVLAKQLTLTGAMAATDARQRWYLGIAPGSESVVTAAAGTLLRLQAGSAGSVIEGFQFQGATRGIESSSGPIHGLVVANNVFTAQTSSAVFLNDSGTDVTIDRNVADASSSTGGGVFHMDTDAFPGLWVTNNWVLGSPNGSGFFSDGNRNVGVSPGRSPRFAGNRFDGNETGVNIGRMSFDGATIEWNGFVNSGYDGLQGGPRNSLIQHNAFTGNGRWGLAFTGFGGAADPNRGAQGNTAVWNEILTNGFVHAGGGVVFSSSQFPGTIATNVVNVTNIAGNLQGAVFSGPETIDVTKDWWGDATGPFHPALNPGGLGNAVVDGPGMLTFIPFSTAEVDTGTYPQITCPADFDVPCAGPAGVPVDLTFSFTSGNPDTWLYAEVTLDGMPHSSYFTMPPVPSLMESFVLTLGAHTVTLRVVDTTTLLESTCSTVVTVVDDVPPVVTCSVSRSLYYPARGALMPPGLTFTATDDCDPLSVTTSVQVFSDEDNGPPPYTPDALDYFGTLVLRSERDVAQDGRVYLIIVSATDGSGNVGKACRAVGVPVAPTVGGILGVMAQMAAAEAACDGSGMFHLYGP